MNQNVKTMWENKAKKVMENLEKNNMQAFYVSTASEVVPLVKELAPAGQTVSNGGSQTLADCGVMDLLRSGDYHFLDRAAPGADVDEIYRKVFFCDTYFSSSNAITEDGKLYNVDGNSNRVAAIAFGPKSVIIIAGVNKIVPDMDSAVKRISHIVAPANTTRLALETPCAVTGRCHDCHSPQRICCSYLVSAQQRIKHRIKVILVGEERGF